MNARLVEKNGFAHNFENFNVPIKHLMKNIHNNNKLYTWDKIQIKFNALMEHMWY